MRIAQNMDFSAITKHQEERIANKKLVGSVAKINIDGKTVWNSAHGFSDMGAKKKMSTNSLFRLASMTKPIAGTAAMQLVESGKLGLHDDISKYIPELKDFCLGAKDENGKIINIGKATRGIEVFHLLTHTSGLAQDAIGYEQFDAPDIHPRKGDTLATAVPRYKNILLDNEPGSAMGYGAIAPFDVLSRIVEIVSDMTFEDYIKKNITDPLGLNDITFHPTAEQLSRLVRIYEIEENNIKEIPDVRENMLTLPETLASGAACLLGTVDDYMIFAECLLNDGELNGTRILKPETVKMMRTPQITPEVRGFNQEQVWGLSMRVVTDRRPEAVLPYGTYGWSGAYGTHFIICPELKLCAVYATNLTNAGGSGAPTAFEFEKDIMDVIRK